MIIQKLFNDQVILATSMRKDGNMRAFSETEFDEVLKNQSTIVTALGGRSDNTARVLTTYLERNSFTEYCEINDRTITEHAINRPETALKLADGLVTRTRDYTLLLPLADCLGVVFFDPEQNILGLLHSGRQNLEEDGAYKFVEFLKQNYNCKPQNLKVYLTAHAQNFEIYALNHAKLAEAAKEQLLRAGIKAENIEASDIDTVINPDFPSNSTGDKTTRFAVAVKLRKQTLQEHL